MHDTLRLVLDAEPVAPRRLNPAIDQDLETICLKCLEKEPAARYASALAVREELDRYLAGLPILARPLNPRQRLWKWSRRHPQVAGLLTAILILVLLGVAGAAVAYRQVVSQRDAARRSETKAKSAAEETVDTLKFVAFDVHDRLRDQPGTELLRQQLLDNTVPRFENLYKQFEDFPESQRVLIKSLLEFSIAVSGGRQRPRTALRKP